jgi:hypothetical protein
MKCHGFDVYRARFLDAKITVACRKPLRLLNARRMILACQSIDAVKRGAAAARENLMQGLRSQ